MTEHLLFSSCLHLVGPLPPQGSRIVQPKEATEWHDLCLDDPSSRLRGDLGGPLSLLLTASQGCCAPKGSNWVYLWVSPSTNSLQGQGKARLPFTPLEWYESCCCQTGQSMKLGPLVCVGEAKKSYTNGSNWTVLRATKPALQFSKISSNLACSQWPSHSVTRSSYQSRWPV